MINWRNEECHAVPTTTRTRHPSDGSRAERQTTTHWWPLLAYCPLCNYTIASSLTVLWATRRIVANRTGQRWQACSCRVHSSYYTNGGTLWMRSQPSHLVISKQLPMLLLVYAISQKASPHNKHPNVKSHIRHCFNGHWEQQHHKWRCKHRNMQAKVATCKLRPNIVLLQIWSTQSNVVVQVLCWHCYLTGLTGEDSKQNNLRWASC